MGSLDGAEASELVGLYLLSKITEIIPKDHLGLYRDDGLAAIENSNGQKLDRLRKKLHTYFQSEGLKITVELHEHSVNFLEIDLDNKNKTYKPYKKPNDTTMYINNKSNHPPSIIKNIPSMISKRLSSISNNENSFNEVIHNYKAALENSGYVQDIAYQNQVQTAKKRCRKRKVTWYNPPYSSNVSTDLGRKFFALIEKHFPKSHPFHKIINRNTVKLSYCCMPSLGRILKGHNKSVLEPKREEMGSKKCNCNDTTTCPLQGNCLQNNDVYKANVKTVMGTTHPYIGLAEIFKPRWYDHNKTFRDRRYKDSSELSKLVWDLKDKNIDYQIEWTILKRSNSYQAGSKLCNLCLDEKLCILKSPDCINKRTELISKCRHKRKFLVKFGT